MSWPIESKAFLTQPISDHERKVYPPEIQDRYPKIAMFESKYIFQTIIFGIYVGFWGCKLYISYHIVISKPSPSKVDQQTLSWSHDFCCCEKFHHSPFFLTGQPTTVLSNRKSKPQNVGRSLDGIGSVLLCQLPWQMHNVPPIIPVNGSEYAEKVYLSGMVDWHTEDPFNDRLSILQSKMTKSSK